MAQYHLAIARRVNSFSFLNFPELGEQLIVPTWGNPVQHQIDLRAADGLCVEWSRIKEAPGHVFVVGGGPGGGLDFCDDKTKTSSPMLNKIVNAIFRHVRIQLSIILNGTIPSVHWATPERPSFGGYCDDRLPEWPGRGVYRKSEL